MKKNGGIGLWNILCMYYFSMLTMFSIHSTPRIVIFHTYVHAYFTTMSNKKSDTSEISSEGAFSPTVLCKKRKKNSNHVQYIEPNICIFLKYRTETEQKTLLVLGPRFHYRDWSTALYCIFKGLIIIFYIRKFPNCVILKVKGTSTILYHQCVTFPERGVSKSCYSECCDYCTFRVNNWSFF